MSATMALDDDAAPAEDVAVPLGAAIVVVVIGRNEGERLRRCLASVLSSGASVVYVDSGSTDGSVAAAKELGADVVALDLSVPFTAARARNAGFQRARAIAPSARRVQFVDGDCEVAAGWLGRASTFLEQRPDVAVVCGRRRERHPERSVYNRLCDDEWDTPVGETRACGGDAMMRIDAFEQAGGYRPTLIAGEEPELCIRLRARGWTIWRLDAEMTLHDAAITRFSQWWRRSERTGFAFAEGARLHGAPPERHWVHESRGAWLWAGALPLLILLATGAWGAVAAWSLVIYPLQVARLALRGRGPASLRLSRAAFLVLGKFAELEGQLRYHLRRHAGGAATLIEYK